MTTDVETVGEDTDLEDVVALMEKRRVKRVPVMRGTKLVGIVSRANLLRALATLSREVKPGEKSDETIRAGVLAELDRQAWAPRHMIDVVVRNGVVELWGTVIDPDQRDAARVVAETVPGVKAVKCHIVWVEPMSGMAFSDPSDEAGETDRRPSSTPTTAHVAVV
jgi:CBS domain-containing protein